MYIKEEQYHGQKKKKHKRANYEMQKKQTLQKTKD
jgi:hypothetical protein